MATNNIVVNNNIDVNTNSETTKQQLINELRGKSADEMCDSISSLILSCESKKDDLLIVKRQLESYRNDAIKLSNKHNQDKLMWTGVKCAGLAVGGLAVFIPGVGWIIGGAISGTIFAANGGIMYGDYQCDKQYEQKVSEIIKQMEEQAIEVLPLAQKVANTKERFDRERNKLIDQGYDRDHASITVIMAMLRGQLSPVQQINITIQESHNVLKNTSLPLPVWKKVDEWVTGISPYHQNLSPDSVQPLLWTVLSTISTPIPRYVWIPAKLWIR